MQPDDAPPVDGPSASGSHAAGSPSTEDLASRRAALRDLAAMIGVEVFY